MPEDVIDFSQAKVLHSTEEEKPDFSKAKVLHSVDEGVKKKEQSGQGSSILTEPLSTSGDENEIGLPKSNLKEFEKRINNPVQYIQNADGSRSTHKMASAGVEGKEIAFPTIVNIDGKLKELPINDAIDHALKTGEYKEFKTQDEASRYAEGGYKKGTPLENYDQSNQFGAKQVTSVPPTSQADKVSQYKTAQEAQAAARTKGKEQEAKEPFLDKVSKVTNDLVGGINRAITNTPAEIAKTGAELINYGGNKINKLFGAKETKIEDNPVYKLADSYTNWMDNNVYKDVDQESTAGQIGAGLGQAGTMIATGGGSTVVKGIASVPKVVKALKTSVVPFAQVFNSEYEGMKQNGESEDVAFEQAIINATATTPLEKLPIANLLTRYKKYIGSDATRRVLNAASQALEEGTTEGIQQVFSNLTNNQLVELDHNTKEWSKDVGNSTEVGGIVGLILGTISGVSQGRLKKNTKEKGTTPDNGQSPPSQDAPPPQPANTGDVTSKRAEILASLPLDKEGQPIVTPEAKAELDKLENQPIQNEAPQTTESENTTDTAEPITNEPTPTEEIPTGVLDGQADTQAPIEEVKAEPVSVEHILERVSKGELSVKEAAAHLNQNTHELTAQIFQPVPNPTVQGNNATPVVENAVLGGENDNGATGNAELSGNVEDNKQPSKAQVVKEEKQRKELIKNEVPTNATTAARQFFLHGGTVSTESLKHETGFGNKDIKSLIGIHNNNSPSIEVVAEGILANNEHLAEKYTSNDVRNAIIDVLGEDRKKWYDNQAKETGLEVPEQEIPDDWKYQQHETEHPTDEDAQAHYDFISGLTPEELKHYYDGQAGHDGYNGKGAPEPKGERPPVDGREPQKGTSENEGEEKSLLNRAFKGQTEEQIREAIAKHGLTYNVEAHAVANEIADGIIGDIGMDNALEAVKNNQIQGAPAAFVMAKGIDYIQGKIDTETNPETLQDLVKQQAELASEFDVKGRTQGQFISALRAVYEQSDFNYSYERQAKQYKEANGGVIPPEVEKQMKDLDEQLKETTKKLKEAEERAKAAEEKAAIAAIKGYSIKKPQGERRGKILIAEGLDEITSALGIKLTAVGDERASVVNGLAKIGQGMIEEGIATIHNVSEKLRKFIQSKFGDKLDFDTYAEEVLSHIEEPRTNGKIGIPLKMLHDLISNGVENIDELVQEVKQRIQHEYPEATDREIRDAITGYGRTIKATKNEIALKLHKLKRIGRIISALEDVAGKKRPLKSGKQREKIDAEERALQKELREAMKELPLDKETLDRQLRTALDAAKQRLKNQIEDLNREIKNNEQVPKSARVLQDDNELEDLRKERDELKKRHEEMFKNEAFIEKKRLEIAKRNTQKKIVDYERRIKESDYSKKTRKQVDADNDLTKLRAEQLEVKDKYDKLQYANQLKNRTNTQKAIDGVMEAWNLTRALRATGEFSFVLIQGGIQSVAHPITATHAFATSLSHFASEARSENWLRELRTKPVYQRMKDSKLALTEPDAKLSVKEEQFIGGWIHYIWDMLGKPLQLASEKTYDVWKKANPVKAVERAGVGYLNTLRVERYMRGEEMLEMQGKNLKNNKEDFKNMADVINTLTGRASLDFAEPIAKPLSLIFFSPRNWASAVKTVTPYAFYHFGKMTSKDVNGKMQVSVAQKMAVADFMKFVGATAGFVALAAAYLNNDDDDETGVEFDPRSSDFMTIKLGNTRIDPWGGKKTQVVFMCRLLTDSMKKNGETKRLGEGKTPTAGELSWKMIENKFSPSMSMINKFSNTHTKKDKATGEYIRTSYGQEYDLGDEALKNLYPIYAETIKETYKDQPATLASFMTAIAFFGMGINTYPSSKKNGKPKDHTGTKGIGKKIIKEATSF